jgi:nucleoside-diphosphate-sugar epimerase
VSLALVTGGAGFIGSHLAKALVERGMNVRILDNFSSGSSANIEGLKAEVREGDIRQLSTVQEAMRGADFVFHHAAMISVVESIEDPRTCYEVNVQGSINLLEAAREHQPKAVVMASSAAVYGSSDVQVKETDAPDPQSPYAASKLAMEGASRQYAMHFGLNIFCLRYFNIYGPNQAADSPYAAVIPQFLHALINGDAPEIYGDGEQTRDFAYVADAIQANLKASGRTNGRAEPINISGGSPISIVKLAALLQQLKPGWPDPNFTELRPGDVRFSSANLDRAKELLQYEPEVDLPGGLRATLEWYEKNSEEMMP